MKFLTIEKLTDLSRYRSLWHCHPKRKAVFQPHRSAGRYSCFSECAQASELNKGLHYKPICQRLAVLAPNRGCQALLLVCRAGQHVVRLVGAMLMLPNCLRTEAFDWPHSLLQGSGTNNNDLMSQWVLFPALKPELSSTLSSNDTWAGIRKRSCGPEQLNSTVTRCDKQHTFGCSNCSYISVLYLLDAICLLASAWMQRSFDTVICSSLGRRGAREGPKKTIKSSEITAACHPNQQVWPESAKKGWKRERKVCRRVPLTHLQICNWTLACAKLTAINPCRVSRLFWWHLQRHLLQTSRAEHPDNQACLTDSDGRLDRSNLSTQIESLQVYVYIWSGLHLSAKLFIYI